MLVLHSPAFWLSKKAFLVSLVGEHEFTRCSQEYTRLLSCTVIGGASWQGELEAKLSFGELSFVCCNVASWVP